MWFLTSKTQTDCDTARDALERSTGSEVADRVIALGALLVQLPEAARNHVNACDDCRIFASELLEVRSMFSGRMDGPQPGPYFMTRVMASIADRELILETKTQTWAAVPRLASRLSVLASLLLLIAGSWLYQRPAHQTTVASVGSEQLSEGLVEGSNSGAPDDLLLNAADR